MINCIPVVVEIYSFIHSNFFTAKEKVGGVSESEKTDSCSKDVHMKFALVFYRSSALWAAA